MQEFIEIEAWLLPTFFLCLHNQLSSVHSFVTFQRVQMFEKGDPQVDSKNECFFFQHFRKVHGKI